LAETPEKFFVVGLNDFEDGLLREWQTDSSNGWGVTSIRVHSGKYAVNSNPGGVYPVNYSAALTASVPISFARGPVLLSFFEQHYFETTQEDYGVVEIGSGLDPKSAQWVPLGERFGGTQAQWQERFQERKFAPHEYLPFGGGARRCIGAAFGLYEMKVVLGTLLARHHFTLVREQQERPVMRNLAMGPKGKVRVTVSPRR
jgi:hypothetical protein